MSKRILEQDASKHRINEYKNIPRSLLDEAWGEMAQKLLDQGIDIGPKATAVVNTRRQIKEGIPK